MRVLVVNRHRGIAGGVETYLERLFPLLQGRSVTAGLLYCQDQALGAAAVDTGCDIAVWKWEPGFAWRQLEQWKPDVVYMHGPPPAEAHSGLIERFPVVQFVHDYRGVCISGHKMHAVPEIAPCQRRFGAACLGLYFFRRCGGMNPLVMIDLYNQESKGQARLRKNRQLLVASEHMRQEYLRHGFGAAEVAVLRLPSTTAAGERPAAKPDGRIVFLGRLAEQKGAHYLIRAAELAQERLGMPLTITLCGAGPDRKRLAALAARAAVTVEMTGWIDAAARLRILRQASVLALPSLWPEPFGMAGLEAASQGLPAVAYDSGGVREWLRPGHSGEVAPANPPTPEGLAGALVRVLGNAGHHQRLCQGAWETAYEFRPELHLEKLLTVLGNASGN